MADYSARVKKLVSAYNKRIDYYTKKYPEHAHMQPQKTTAKEVIQNIANYDDFRKAKRNLENYNAKTALPRRKPTKLDNEVRKEIRNFNKRVDYHEKDSPYKGIQPRKLNSETELKYVKTAKDARELIASLRNYNAKTAEAIQIGDEIATKYAANEVNKQIAKVNRQNKVKQKKIGEKDLQITADVTMKVKDYKPDYYTNLDPIKNNAKTKKGLDTLLSYARRRSKEGYKDYHNRHFFENYLLSVDRQFSSEVSKKLKPLIIELGAERLAILHEEFPEAISITYNYDKIADIAKYNEIVGVINTHTSVMAQPLDVISIDDTSM